MKILKQILMMSLLVVGLSMTAMAQKNDDQNRPPKQDPPKINPGEKPPKPNPPKNEDRPKKPQGIIFVSGNRVEFDYV